MPKADKIASPTQMVEDILKKMNYGGHNPKFQNIYTKIYSYTMMFVFLFSFILQNIYVLTHKYEDLAIMIMDIVVLAAVWQIFTKTFFSHLKAKYILKLMDLINNKFWKDDMFNEEERISSQKIYKYTLVITKFYTVSIFLTMFGHASTAVLRGNHNLVLNCWFPTPIKEILFTSPYFEILALSQTFVMGSCTLTGLLQMDNLFVTAIAIILAQLRVLKSRLLTIGKGGNIANDSKLVIKCIDHHNLLFEAVAIIETIYSVLILHLLATNILLGVITMLGMLVENNITQIIEFIFILVSVFGQLYIYCLLGQFIQDETLTVADAAYNCKWEDMEDRNIKFCLLMTIQRSHKSAQLTMGGFLILCLENFTRISRLMISILTLMVNMRPDE